MKRKVIFLIVIFITTPILLLAADYSDFVIISRLRKEFEEDIVISEILYNRKTGVNGDNEDTTRFLLQMSYANPRMSKGWEKDWLIIHFLNKDTFTPIPLTYDLRNDFFISKIIFFDFNSEEEILTFKADDFLVTGENIAVLKIPLTELKKYSEEEENKKIDEDKKIKVKFQVKDKCNYSAQKRI